MLKLPARFAPIVDYMNQCLQGAAHDAEHVLRVLHYAADIAYYTPGEKDMDVLVAAAMLHDIGRPAQDKDGSLDHAAVGAEMAYDFLRSVGWSDEKATHVKDCIFTHRFRTDHPPASLEAMILFDSDKLDVTGAMGVARSFSYCTEIGEPYYTKDANGKIEDGSQRTKPGGHSFFHEYHFKLKDLAAHMHTARAKEIATEHKPAMDGFYRLMLDEVHTCYARGALVLPELLTGEPV